MKKEVKNESFVFYQTSLQAVEQLEEAYPEMAGELLRAIVEYGIYGTYDDSNPIIAALMVNIGFGIDQAKSRYTAAIENGGKGGRPKKIDDNEVIRLKEEENLTNPEIAKRLNCSLSSVEKKLKVYRDGKKEGKQIEVLLQAI